MFEKRPSLLELSIIGTQQTQQAAEKPLAASRAQGQLNGVNTGACSCRTAKHASAACERQCTCPAASALRTARHGHCCSAHVWLPAASNISVSTRLPRWRAACAPTGAQTCSEQWTGACAEWPLRRLPRSDALGGPWGRNWGTVDSRITIGAGPGRQAPRVRCAALACPMRTAVR
jgi:hypothetical protein